MRKKRILLLTQWFEPEPTFKGLVFARELAARGYDVEVVTGFPNYPGGTLYPGYRMSWLKREVIDGISVTRVPLYPSHDGSAVRRIANYASFAATAALYCVFFARKADAVYVYQLPTLGVVAALIKFFRGTPFVIDIQDLWPDTLRATGMVSNRHVLAAVDCVTRWTYRQADRVVVLSPGFRGLLRKRGVPTEKVELIYNWCDEASLESSQERDVSSFPNADVFSLVFAGNMGKAQALDAVLDAAELLQDRSAAISIVMIGGGVETDRLMAVARERRLRNVLFLPRVGIERIGVILREADALLIHLKDDPLFEITIPGKTQAYMAIGKPVLIAAKGDAAALVRNARCGLEAIPGNPESIAGAVADLASLSQQEREDMGNRGKSFYRDFLSLKVGIDQFVRVFESTM